MSVIYAHAKNAAVTKTKAEYDVNQWCACQCMRMPIKISTCSFFNWPGGIISGGIMCSMGTGPRSPPGNGNGGGMPKGGITPSGPGIPPWKPGGGKWGMPWGMGWGRTSGGRTPNMAAIAAAATLSCPPRMPWNPGGGRPKWGGGGWGGREGRPAGPDAGADGERERERERQQYITGNNSEKKKL